MQTEIPNMEDDEPDNRRRNEAPVAPEPMLLQDLEQYLEAHGLQERVVGAQSESNMASARKRVREEEEYQESIHRAIFAQEPQSVDQQRLAFLARVKDDTIDVHSATDVLREVPLKPLAEACETVYTLASFRKTFQGGESERLALTLDSFQHSAVHEFVEIVLGRMNAEDVSADCVVECCQIARYMLCPTVLESMVEILVRSVDNANCMSLCQLADQLDLPRLFERSMSQMMQSVTDIQDLEVWTDLTPELRDRILAIENALRSSVRSSGGRLYFSSLNEYLSIFAENVQYYRERLAEAKERQAQVPPTGHAYKDAQAKILKQERRVQTLEFVLKEQKELFASKGEVRHMHVAHIERRP